ncbi:MAG TPA: hypothetical protein VER36_08215 [Flavisolibacter sp.]|nr:hypothetical protein [Flavisolibacter sp.]
MKNVLLRFDSLLDLWCFKQKARLTQVEIVAEKNLLIGELNESMVQLAIRKYHAQLMAAA